MFTLTDDELENGFAAINHHGYSAMLPDPIEWKTLKGNWDEIKSNLVAFDLDTYVPNHPMKVFAPKNRANIRVVHLLHPIDLVIYTSLVMIVKDDIEASRISRQAKRVYSYRVDTGSDKKLYDAKGWHDKYHSQLVGKSDRTSIKFVALADIADFYPRIYQHRLENAIQAISTSQRATDVARVLVRKLISNLMEKNSYGIPVGPYASRILAEAVLIDVDSYLHSSKFDFVRWVDDYTFFCKSEYEAQATLFSLGEWLYNHHGLTLQSAKTKILPVDRYRDEVLVKPEETLSDRDHAIEALKEFDTGDYEDDWADEDELDEDEIQAALEELQRIDLIAMLVSSVSDRALVDYEVVKYVLTRLPRIKGAAEELKNNVLDLVIEHAELLYPVSEHIAKYVMSFNGLPGKDKKKIAKKLLKPLKSKRNPPPEYYAMWMLHIFASSGDWNQVKDIVQLYRDSPSNVIKRYCSLVVAESGARADALAVVDGYPSAPDMLKLAILEASKNMGVDERKHWKLSNSVSGLLEKKL